MGTLVALFDDWGVTLEVVRHYPHYTAKETDPLEVS